MATLARSALRKLLSEAFDDHNASTTTSAGDADGTTVVDTALANQSADNDFCIGWWVTITELVSGGPAVGESKKITSYTASTNTITVVSAFTAQVKTGTDYELSRINPTLKNNAIARASVLCFPSGSRRGLYLPIRDESLIVDNLLTNGSLDTFSVTFTGWTNIGTPSLAAETSRKVHGTGSASITASGATEGIEQNLFTSVNIREVTNRTLHIRGWVFATVASAARLRVTFDGTTYTNASWHTGDAEWENDATMYIDVTVPDDATEMTVSCEVTDGNTAYFDLVRAWIDPIHEYTLPTAMLRGPFEVLQQAYIDRPEGPYWPIAADELPRPGHVLRLTGMGLLSQPSTDAGTVEIDTNQAEYFLAQASQWLYRAVLNSPSASAQEREYIRQFRQEWQQDIARMEQGGGTTMPNLAAERPMGVWKVVPDLAGTGRELHFLQER